MDRQLVRSYRARQADPVFGKKLAQPKLPERSLTALIIYAALAGFSVVICCTVLLNHLGH